MAAWTEKDNELLKEYYALRMPVSQICVALGRSSRAVIGHAYRLKCNGYVPHWSLEEENLLRDAYKDIGVKQGFLTELSKRLGRRTSNICRKARELGLVRNQKRKKEITSARSLARMEKSTWTPEQWWEFRSQIIKKAHAKYGHPRGMLGKHHNRGIAPKTRMARDAR
jgi:hypothetical protein